MSSTLSISVSNELGNAQHNYDIQGEYIRRKWQLKLPR